MSDYKIVHTSEKFCVISGSLIDAINYRLGVNFYIIDASLLHINVIWFCLSVAFNDDAVNTVYITRTRLHQLFFNQDNCGNVAFYPVIEVLCHMDDLQLLLIYQI